jgi:hypothetical protein
MPCFRWLVAILSLWRPRFTPRSVHVGFTLDKVLLGQVFLRLLQFPLSIPIHHGFYSNIIWGMNNRPVGGSNSEISSPPIDMNNHPPTRSSNDTVHPSSSHTAVQTTETERRRQNTVVQWRLLCVPALSSY